MTEENNSEQSPAAQFEMPPIPIAAPFSSVPSFVLPSPSQIAIALPSRLWLADRCETMSSLEMN